MSNSHVYVHDAVCRFHMDHAHSNLIWNLKTREELRDALEGEMRSFTVDRELGSATVISWNHQEFEVCWLLVHSSTIIVMSFVLKFGSLFFFF